MAVGFATLTATLVPSAFALTDSVTTTPVSTTVNAGDLTITGFGNYTGSAIALNSLSSPVLAQTTVSALTNASTDYIDIVDGTATTGVKMHAYLNSLRWVHAGTLVAGTTRTMTASNTNLTPAVDSGSLVGVAPAISKSTGTIDGTKRTALATSYGFFLNSGMSSAQANAATAASYTFPNTLAGNGNRHKAFATTPTASNVYFKATTPGAWKGEVKVRRLSTLVQQDQTPGTYTNTLNFVLVDGSL